MIFKIPWKSLLWRVFLWYPLFVGSPKILRWPSFQVVNPATKWFIELHRFFISSFTDLHSQTKSLKDKKANLWSSINHLVAGLPTSNYLHREKNQFPLFSLKWKNKNHGAKNTQFYDAPCGVFLIFKYLFLYDQSPTLSPLAFSYCTVREI